MAETTGAPPGRLVGPFAAALVVVTVGIGALAASSPTHALVAAAVVVGVVAIAARPQWALLALVAVGPLESAFPTAEGATFTIVKAAGAVSFVAFAVDAVAGNRRLHFDRVHGVLALLAGLALVSTLGAHSVGDGLSTTSRYASFALLYFVATQYRDDRALPAKMAWTMSLSSGLAAVLALQNYFSGRTFAAAPAYGDVNDLAFILVTTLPVTTWLVGVSRRARPIAAALVALLALTVLLSFSRGALLALGVGVVWHASTERRHIPLLVAVAAVALLAGLLVVGHNEDRISTTLLEKRNIAAYNVETRLDAWHAAAQLASERPLLGVGPGNFGFYYFDKTGRPPGTFGLRVVHDAYLDIAAELGMVGLVLFLLYLGAVFSRATVAIRERRGRPGLATALRTGLVIAMVASLTLSEQYYPPFWVLGAMASMVWSERLSADVR